MLPLRCRGYYVKSKDIQACTSGNKKNKTLLCQAQKRKIFFVFFQYFKMIGFFKGSCETKTRFSTKNAPKFYKSPMCLFGKNSAIDSSIEWVRACSENFTFRIQYWNLLLFWMRDTYFILISGKILTLITGN